MSIMLPSVISPEVKSSAERRIFDWFQEAPGTDDWIVLHSLGIATHNKVIYGETDFFVLIPKRGIFALEVKGGRVRRENGIWYYTDKHGKTSSKERGPFDQARDGVFSIVSSLKQRLDSNHQDISKVFFGFGVMFPDIVYKASGIDEEQWQVFDSRDGRNVNEYMERLFLKSKDKWETLYGPLDSNRLPSSNDVRYIAKLLRGDFDYAVSLVAQLRNAEESLIKLTEEQYRCIDQLDDNPRCLIHGPAGTGKTLLAIEAVKKAVAQGKRTALFCYNTNLAEWLSWLFSKMPESLRPQYVGTLHGYMMQQLRKKGSAIQFPKKDDELHEYYEKKLPTMMLQALDSEELVSFDEVVFDEAQDLIKTEYLCVVDSILRKGITRGQWIMFGDFSMQAIYSGGQTGEEILGLLEEYTSFIRFRLTTNCRNTKPICEEIHTLTGFEIPADLWTKIEGPPVNYITWNSMEDEKQKLLSLLNELDTQHVEKGKVTILSPRRRENSVVSFLDRTDIKDYRVDNSDSISFCTIQAYKGLENTIIIMTDIEDYNSEKLMYVGLSRARVSLFILESENAAQQYQSLFLRRVIHA